MRNAGLDKAQAGIKIAGRNINSLTYADGTTLMAESEEELKSENNTLQVQGLALATLLCPWDLPGKSTGVGFAMPVARGTF